MTAVSMLLALCCSWDPAPCHDRHACAFWPATLNHKLSCMSMQALLKQLRDKGTLADLAGAQAAGGRQLAAQQPPAAATAPAPPPACPAVPASARTPRRSSGSSGSREMQRLLQSQQQGEAALLHEDLFPAPGTSFRAGLPGRKRTRQQRQQARPLSESAGLSLLLLRGDSQAAESILRAAEGSFASRDEEGEEEEEHERAPPRQRQRCSSGQAGQRATDQQPQQLALVQEEEAVLGLICLATSPTAAEAAAAEAAAVRSSPWSSGAAVASGSSGANWVAGKARLAPGQAAEEAGPQGMAASLASSPAASAGSGRSSSEQWGKGTEGGGTAAMAVDSTWHAEQAGHTPVVPGSKAHQQPSVHEQERQRQQRLLTLLSSCIQRALAKQQQQRRWWRQQGDSSHQQAGGTEDGMVRASSSCSEGPSSSHAGDDDTVSAAAAAEPISSLAAAQALLALTPAVGALPAVACAAGLAQQQRQQQQQVEAQQRLAAAMLLYQHHHKLASVAGRHVEQQHVTPNLQACAVPCLHLPLVQMQVPVQLVSPQHGPAPQRVVVQPAVHTSLHRAASAPAQHQRGSPQHEPATCHVLPAQPAQQLLSPRQVPPEWLALLRSRSLLSQPPITTGHWQMPKSKGKAGAVGASGASKAVGASGPARRPHGSSLH